MTTAKKKSSHVARTRLRIPRAETRREVHPRENQTPPAHRPSPGSGLGAFADEFDKPHENPLRQNPALPPIHRHRPRRTTRHRQCRRHPRRRNARPRPSLRRLFRQRCRVSHSRLRPHGHKSGDPYQRRRRHQSQLFVKAPGRHQRSHQSARRQSSFRTNDERFGPRFPT